LSHDISNINSNSSSSYSYYNNNNYYYYYYWNDYNYYDYDYYLRICLERLASETSRLVFTARLCPQVRMPPVRNARRTLCPILSSERAQIPNFRTRCTPNLCRVFERTCLQCAYVIPCQMGSSAVLRARCSALVLAANHRRAHSIGRGCRVHTCIMAIGSRLQNVSPPSVLFKSSQIFFTIHRRHRHKKMMDQNSEIRIL